MNSRTMDKEDIVAVVTVDGEEYMQYREVPIDTLVIRGPTQMKQGISVRKKRQWFWRFFLLSWQPNGLEER